MGEEQERRLAAIMFCDVCSFSRIMGEDENRALAIVGMAISCIESGAEIYGGRIIKKLGDGALCEFPSAVYAVRCAVDVQKAIADHNSSAKPVDQFQLRIGIHVGDVVVSGGDILGDGVNVASRIQPLAEPGGICISRDVFDLVKSKVSIETVNLGPHDLKNISRQIDIYKILVDAVSGDRPRAPVARRMPVRWRRILKWAAAMLALVIVAIAARFIIEILQVRNARRQYEAVTSVANQMLLSGKTNEAVQCLQSYQFRNDPWRTNVDQTIAKLETDIASGTVKSRELQFLKALKDKDENAALRMIDPEILQKADIHVLWEKMRTATHFLRIVESGPDSLSIEGVDLSPDRINATVWMKLREKTPTHPEGIWQDIPPSEWRDVNGTWYLRVGRPRALSVLGEKSDNQNQVQHAQQQTEENRGEASSRPAQRH
jgi:class 3 adenylate cyclase